MVHWTITCFESEMQHNCASTPASRSPPRPTGLMNHMFSCLHILAHPAWPDPTRTHQSRSSMHLSNCRNGQLQSQPSTTKREGSALARSQQSRQKRWTGRGEPGWDRAEQTSDGWVRLEGGGRGEGLRGRKGKNKSEFLLRYRSSVTQRC